MHLSYPQKKGKTQDLTPNEKRRLGRLFWGSFGVADGTRTRDDRNHNPGLYQLSYSHREPMIIARDRQVWRP